jgi:hypothetical protein
MPVFQPYRRLNGESGVEAFALTRDGIYVRFHDGVYLYTYACPGRADVERMKALALSGRGLSTYISRHVKTRYAEKRRL